MTIIEGEDEDDEDQDEDYIDEGGQDKYNVGLLASGHDPELLKLDAMEAFKEDNNQDDIPEEATTELVDNTRKAKAKKIVNPYESKTTKRQDKDEDFPPYYLVATTIWHETGDEAVCTCAYKV